MIPPMIGAMIGSHQYCTPSWLTQAVEYPVMNDASAINILQNAVHQTLGSSAVAPTDQSLGGEDFAWYLEHVPGAMARLGVRPPTLDTTGDLHTPTFDPSEESIPLGTTLLTSTALLD